MSIPLSQIGQERRVDCHRPWPRAIVDTRTWNLAASQLALGELSLVGLWGEADCVHMAPVSYTHLTLPTIYSV